MSVATQNQGRYQAAIYQLALAAYMGETEAKMTQLLATVAGEFNVPVDKVQRDVGIKSRNHFIAANR